MPKLKSHSGAKKRFRINKNGKIKKSSSNRRHILNKKSTKRKRRLRKPGYVDSTNTSALKSMLPYS